MVKYRTLAGSLLALIALGSVYAWSLFNLPLSEKYGSSISAVTFTFGIMTLFLAIGSSGSGFIKLRIGMQNTVILSAICTGAGLLLAAFAPNLFWLYLSAGVLLGFGDGLGYMLVLTNCVKFFPHHKGLISALCIGAYGLGSLLFKYIDSYTLETGSIDNALLTWGLLAAVLIAGGAMLSNDAMKEASVVSGATSSKREYNLHLAIRTVPYWLLTVMFFIDCMVGLYVIGVASSLGTELANLPATEAATAVSIIAIANIAGRLIMGVLSDRLPRIRLITFDQILSVSALCMLLFLPVNTTLFFSAVALIAFSFGGTLTIYPSLISDYFGIRNLAINYGLLYLGFGLGSLSGYAIAFIFDSITLTFIIMSVLLAVAIVMSLMVHLPAELSSSHNEIKKEIEEEKIQAASPAPTKKGAPEKENTIPAQPAPSEPTEKAEAPQLKPQPEVPQTKAVAPEASAQAQADSSPKDNAQASKEKSETVPAAQN